MSRCFDALRPRSPTWMAELRDGLAEYGAEPEDFAQMVVGTGPGSFSGIRAAIAALQGMALPRQVPVFGLTSSAVLAGLAARASRAEEGTVTVVGDARRNRLWCAVYCWCGDHLTVATSGMPPTHSGAEFVLTTWEGLPAHIPPGSLLVSPDRDRLGDGLARLPGVVLDEAASTPDAAGLARLFFSAPNAARRDPSPIYLHPAVAH